jgi:hypothetical protein
MKQGDHSPFKFIIFWDNELVSRMKPEVAILVQGILVRDGFKIFLVVMLCGHHGWYGRVNGCSINEHGIGECGFPFRF